MMTRSYNGMLMHTNNSITYGFHDTKCTKSTR
jgi:hypothetical protein